jgi:hypothetical protein
MTRDQIEATAALLHRQWCISAAAFYKNVRIPGPRLERWRELHMPYEELSEELKASTREWAEEFLVMLDRATR